jgi:hypothetical protein
MDLRDFISQALVDIISGVADAQKKIPDGEIVPNVAKTFTAVEHGVSDIQSVGFEVTVRADEREGSEAKLNVVTAIIGGGVKGEIGKSGGHAATLSFKVPIRLPPWGKA